SDHGTHSGASSEPSPGMSSTSSTVGSSPSTCAIDTVQRHPGYPGMRLAKSTETTPSPSSTVPAAPPTVDSGVTSRGAFRASAVRSVVGEGSVSVISRVQLVSDVPQDRGDTGAVLRVPAVPEVPADPVELLHEVLDDHGHVVSRSPGHLREGRLRVEQPHGQR